MWRYISFCLAAALLSCSYPERPDKGDESEEEVDISISYLKSLYSGHPVRITQDYRITGYVMSTDAFGNYYKTLAIEDETGGIEVRIDSENIFEIFRQSDRVEIHCNSLTLGAYGGLVQLGAAPTGIYEVGYIDQENISAHIRVDGRADSNPTARVVTIPDLNPAMLSCLIRIYGVRFIDEDQGLLWCDPDRDSDRTIEDGQGNRLTVRTSYRSRFASELLPRGSGYIEGILSWFNDKYQLRVINPLKVDMQQP